MNYYNDNNPEAAAWLRELIKAELIPNGDVDERSIADVNPTDLTDYTQCHFFAGIGGWPYALQLANFTGPVWTGSCPCQPFSCAGKQLAEADPRHLWPQFLRLIAECKPPTVFGEQVASRLGYQWIESIAFDLDYLGYAVGSADLPAASVGAPHIRQRLFWVASHTDRDHEDWRRGPVQMRRERCEKTPSPNLHREGDQWTTEPRPVALAYGVPNRVALLNGYGNAIVPQVAAKFIQAFLECNH